MSKKHTPTIADEALFSSMLSTQTIVAIQQAHIDNKMDTETYNHLYTTAQKADIQVKKVVKLLEGEISQVVQCAIDQARKDFPYVEVVDAVVNKKVEYFRIKPELLTQGIRWYIEIEVSHLQGETPASILYRVWRDEGTFQSTRVTIV